MQWINHLFRFAGEQENVKAFVSSLANLAASMGLMFQSPPLREEVSSPRTPDYKKGKVHIFWEGHKILRNLHLTFVQCQSKVRWRYRKILWPFQNIWALRNDTSFESSESFPPFFHRNHGRSSGLLFPTKSSPFISINYSDFIYPFFACDFKLDFLFYWISLLSKFN